MPFVTPEQANHNWRAGIAFGDSPDTSADDPRFPRLEQCLVQAESVILNYLKVTEESPAWTPAEADLPNVQAAILIFGKTLYDENHEAQAHVMLPNGIVPLLLARMRDPAIA